MNKIVLPPFNAMLHSEYNLGRIGNLTKIRFGSTPSKRLRFLIAGFILLFIVALSQRRASIDADQTDYINDSLDTLSTNALDQLDSDSGLSKISKLHFKADGFKYCYNLNNATFNLDSVIHNWPNTPPQRISEINPTTQQFTEFIDERAKKMYNTIMKIHKGAFVKEQTRRLMCYMAAEGSNALANLTDSRLVHEIDRVAYFSSFLPAIVPPTLPVSIPTPDSINDPKERKRYRHLRKDGSKRKYDLAYLIMAHGNMSRIQSIETLVDELDDGSAIFLIHVDKRKESLPLMKAVKDFIAKREQAVNDFIKSQKLSIDAWDDADVAGNVFMAATPFEVSWGHGSIMWSQMNGFWELLDLADWKHIINLSSQDYPLRASREIARILNQPKFDGFNFLDTWPADFALAKRLLPFLHLQRRKHLTTPSFHMNQLGMTSPPFPRWKYVKHHQWMILTREFIEFSRSSNIFALAFAYYEHSLIPDESFLGTVIKNLPQFNQRLASSKRYFKWQRNSPHPEILGPNATFGIDKEDADPKYLFARKVDASTSQGMDLIGRIRTEYIFKHLRNDKEYPQMEGTLFTPPK